MSVYLSVIVPAFNEEQRIPKTLDRIYDYLRLQSYSWEILVVLDGCTDKTLERVQQFSADKKNVRCIVYSTNRGKGYSVRQGMLAARGQIRLFTDADNSTDISHFEKMQYLFENGHDIVICSRNAKDVRSAQQAVAQPFLKRLLGSAGNLFIQLVAVPGIWDTQCGFKAFTGKAAERIFAVAEIDRWGFDIEVLAIARQFEFHVSLVPAFWVNDTATNVSLRSYLEVLLEAIKVRWNIVNGTYINRHALRLEQLKQVKPSSDLSRLF